MQGLTGPGFFCSRTASGSPTLLPRCPELIQDIFRKTRTSTASKGIVMGIRQSRSRALRGCTKGPCSHYRAHPGLEVHAGPCGDWFLLQSDGLGVANPPTPLPRTDTGHLQKKHGLRQPPKALFCQKAWNVMGIRQSCSRALRGCTKGPCSHYRAHPGLEVHAGIGSSF